MIYNPRPFERLLTRFLAKQAKELETLIDRAVADVTRQAGRAGHPQGSDFRFRDYPALSRRVDEILRSLTKEITKSVTTGIEWSWDLANVMNDAMLLQVVKSIGESRLPRAALARWSQRNLDALAAFQSRKVGGLGLSEHVWTYVKPMKGDLELALDLGLGEGMSADRLSRAVRRFLREPERLFRRVRDEKGQLHLSKAASSYHPGQGVYRSSYMNAKRLAATETNMAYRLSDTTRRQELGFCLGYRVCLSNNHTCLDANGVPQPFYDICDELAGVYPSDFDFRGWHPFCRCYTVTLLPSEDEFFKYLDAMDENGVSSYKFSGVVTDVPPQFKEWVAKNSERIERAEARGTMPYFLRDNTRYWTLDEPAPSIDKEFSEASGLKAGAPMSYEEADTGRENPNYSEVGGAYRVNCQTCTVIHELRRRGFDVEAAPKDKGKAIQNSMWKKRFLNADGTAVSYDWSYTWMREKEYKKMTGKRVQEFIGEKAKDAGRYEIYVKWKERESAHVFIGERDAQGKMRYFDPQTGAGDVSHYFKSAEGRYVAVLRIDDKKVNPLVSSVVVSK